MNIYLVTGRGGFDRVFGVASTGFAATVINCTFQIVKILAAFVACSTIDVFQT